MKFKIPGRGESKTKAPSEQPVKIRAASLSDPGGRAINDDTACIQQGNQFAHVYVGDGLGGYAGGRQASQAAGKALMAAGKNSKMLTDAQLHNACVDAELAVKRLQRITGGNMKTTLVYLAVEKDTARWMHVGDSRLYCFRNGKLHCQTADHSVSQMAVLMGEITVDQIRHHEDRNRVLRALGGESAKPELSAPLQLGEEKTAFLLCTDGFWEYVLEPEMEQTLQSAASPEEWIRAMEKILLTRVDGENDNYTAAAVFYR